MKVTIERTVQKTSDGERVTWKILDGKNTITAGSTDGLLDEVKGQFEVTEIINKVEEVNGRVTGSGWTW